VTKFEKQFRYGVVVFEENTAGLIEHSNASRSHCALSYMSIDAFV